MEESEEQVLDSVDSLQPGTEVVQIIMQDQSGGSVMPHGQYVQVNMPNGESQMIQLSTVDGQTQFIQIQGEDGQNQLIQVSPNEEPRLIEVAPSEAMPVMEGVSAEEDISPVTGELENTTGHLQMETLQQTDQLGESESNQEGQAVVEEQETKHGELNGEAGAHPDNGQPPSTQGETETGQQAQGDAPATSTTAEPPKKMLDMTSPIELTSETVVVVDGKKCVLRVDPDTNHLVAYPFKPDQGKRRRGRPRKVVKEDSVELNTETEKENTSGNTSQAEDVATEGGGDTGVLSNPGLSEQENSAAEGLLGLSDTGPDGRRRSNRIRKKATFLSDYEMGKIEGVEEEEEDEGGTDDGEDEETSGTPAMPGFSPFKRPRGRPPKNPLNSKAVQGLFMNVGLIPAKRGRGRPRRNPLPNSNLPGPIPAFIIPSPGGQAVMMAPMQGLGQLQQTSKSTSLVPIRPKPPEGVPEQPPSIMIQKEDGTEINIQVLSEQPEAESEDSSKPDEGSEDTADAGEDEDEEVEDADDEDGEPAAKKQKKSVASKSVMPPAAVIQLPQNLVPLLLPKKEPVKIGLKASESDLEKLKCPKCEFQGYYSQQYQEHIASHAEDIQKCKCCNFLTFDKEGLLEHMKDAHPKCICDICDFTAEHAYVIKRHMMRHNTQGCECEICGKTYKDQYILKMHVKLVHMPAEVLFECNICAKKFTRKAHLKRHLRIHEPEKPFKCPRCEYRGCERSDITKHLLIHEEPKHMCEVCGKAFRHIKNKELHVKRHKGQRDYKCGVCDFYGYTFTDIRKHIERKHSDSKNILCDKCGSAFKSDALLKEHQKRQCELMMIEQALAVAGGQDGQTTIHIPATQIGPDGQFTVDGSQVNITVEQVALPDDEVEAVSQVVSLTEAQMAEAHMAVSEGQVLDTSQVELMTVAESHMTVAESHMTVAESHMTVAESHMTVAEVEDADSRVSQVEISDNQFITTQTEEPQLVVSQEDVDLVQTEEIRPDDENMIALAQ